MTMIDSYGTVLCVNVLSICHFCHVFQRVTHANQIRVSMDCVSRIKSHTFAFVRMQIMWPMITREWIARKVSNISLISIILNVLLP